MLQAETRKLGEAHKAGASRLLTVKEAAEVLRVCTATVYAMVRRGELAYVRVSNSIRILCTPAHEKPRKE